ncbi:MAG: hypothetical protein ACJZ47_00870 [bacterium]
MESENYKEKEIEYLNQTILQFVDVEKPFEKGEILHFDFPDFIKKNSLLSQPEVTGLNN